MTRTGCHYAALQSCLGRPVAPSETTFELTHLMAIGSHLPLQLGVQYVIWPTADPRISNALVGQARVEVTP